MSAFKQIALRHDFGVENFLEPESKVLYENIFNTKHIGREIDLFLFEAKNAFMQAKEPAFFEYRFRHILEHLIFNAWTNYRTSDQQKCLELEVGWDQKKVVLSITWSVDSNLPELVPGAPQASATPTMQRIQRLVEYSRKWSDGLCVRHGTRASRLQVVCILQLDVTQDGLDSRQTEPEYDWVSINEETVQKTEDTASTKPEALSASNLKEFKDDEQKRSQSTVNTEIAPALNITATVQNPGVSEDWLTRVAGDEPKVDDSAKVFKQDDEVAEEELKVFNQANDEANEELRLKDLADGEELASMQIKSLIGDVCKGYTQEQLDEMVRMATHSVRETMSKAMESALARQKISEEGKLKLYKDQIASLSENVERLKALNSEMGSGMPKEAKTDVASNADSEKAARKKINDLEVQLNKALQGNRMHEEALKQKESIISKTKEAFTQAMKSLEKYKNSEKTSDRGELIAKIVATEKMLSVAQANSMNSQKKSDELTQKWMSESSLRVTLQKEVTAKTKQIEDLKRRIENAAQSKGSNKAEENANRMIEALKGQVRLLQEKLAVSTANANRAAMQSAADSKRGSPVEDVEMKHKLGQANKMIRAMKDENEKIKKKFEDLKAGETKMKVEISRLQNLLKKK